MKLKKFNIADFRSQSASLPREVPDFQHIAPVATQRSLSVESRQLLAAYAPLLDTVDWQNEMAGAPEYRKVFELTAKLVTAQMLRNCSRIGRKAWTAEATLAGTDIPSYARQMLMTIVRAYPQLFAIQLFGVTPFTGPDGRIFFKDFKYNSAFAGSAPNIADGDRTDDLTKFNKDFFKIGQGAQANKLKMSITSMTVGVDSYRVVGDWTYESEDDLEALYNSDVENSMIGHMAQMMSWVTDRTMVETAAAAVPAANKVTWDSADGGAYASYAPTEKAAYDQTLYSKGILSVISKIEQGRVYSLTPNWAICGPKAAEKLQSVKSFVPTKVGPTALSLSTGMKDIGELTGLGLRVLVDPQYTTNKILFGRRPTGEFDPAIHYCPYRPLRTTAVLEDPEFGTKIKGVYSRFGVADPDTGQNAASSQLADSYGELTLSNLP